MKIKVINKSNNSLPVYSTTGASCIDLKASFTELDFEQLKGTNIEYSRDEQGIKVVIHPFGRILIPTDLYMEIPDGYELQIRARSGLAIKNGITMVNGVGTIDSDYRGNIGIILMNTDYTMSFTIRPGDRIAQAALCKVETIEFEEVLQLSNTNRGEGGYGSTGNK